MTSNQAYLKRYFAERNLDTSRIITVEHTGITETFEEHTFTHMIDVGEVIRLSIEVAKPSEQQDIVNMIRKIEFFDPSSIHGFIDHLAYCYVMNFVA